MGISRENRRVDLSTIFVAMYITDAKSKLPIVRKRRATRDRNGSCKLKAASSVASLVSDPRVRRRPSSMFSPRALTTRKGKEQRVYRPSSALACHASIIHMYTGDRVAGRKRESAEDAGVAPRRATMPACTDARMCPVLHAFFTPPHIHTHSHIHLHATVRSHGERPSLRS